MDWVRTFAERAAEGFGGEPGDLFTTSNYQAAVYREFGTMPPPESVERVLENRDDVVRVSDRYWKLCGSPVAPVLR